MGILGIHNRTENWKTATHFSPLLSEKSHRLVQLLGDLPRFQTGEVRLELYWKGIRDRLYQDGVKKSLRNKNLLLCITSYFPACVETSKTSVNFKRYRRRTMMFRRRPSRQISQ